MKRFPLLAGSFLAIVLPAGSIHAILAQQPSMPASTPLSFEVASMKVNEAGGGAYLQPVPGRLVITNFSVRQLILLAYGIQGYQISGDPPWMGSDHYDIQAKAENNAPVKEMEGPMLQALLADRFKLTLHRNTRQLPVYELTLVKGGARLERPKEGGCTPYSVVLPSPSPVASGQPRPTFCGYFRFGSEGLMRTLDGAAVTMDKLAASLPASELGRSVIDRTGLKGTFDVHLKWALDPPATLAGNDGTSSSGPTGPSIFVALQEQLGLKLESTKGPVEVIVIDHAEKPPSN